MQKRKRFSGSTLNKTKQPLRKKKGRKKKINKRRLFILVCVVFLLLSICGLFLSYLYVDNMVYRHLQNKLQKQEGMAFSAPFTLQSGMRISADVLTQTLRTRGYINGTGSVINQGEFKVQGSVFKIYARGFTDAENLYHSPQIYTYDTATTKLLTIDQNEEELLLEPIPISSLASGEHRASSYLALEEIPKNVQQAVITIEDERFFNHSGIDLIGILRAVFANIKAGSIVQGGSTLTQQLAKNTLFTPRKTLGRKILEALAAISLEKRLSKNEILERYLNEVYLGQEGSVAIHGVAEAAETFFDKKIATINTSEAALLAGIIKAPSYYSPKRHLKRALNRREIVLKKMIENGAISVEEGAAALQYIPKIKEGYTHTPLAPYFHVALLKDLEEKINLDVTALSGMRIYTGLSPELQKCATAAIAEELPAIEERYPALKRKKSPLAAALVAIEPHSGLIKAWVGGRNYATNQFDHVSQGFRQIGSTVKPFLYLTALDGGLNTYKVATADSILPDKPTIFTLPNNKTWTPLNYDKKYHGDVTLRYALEKSLNIPAAYIGGKVGVKALAHTLSIFHIAEDIPEVPAITLGAIDTSLLKLTAAYGALANSGIYVTPRLFSSVIDRTATTIAKTPFQEERLSDEGAVYVLTNILQGVVDRGTGAAIRRLGYKRAAAGKTGTSDNARDAWFVGYTPNLVAGVWLGFDDNKKIGVTGGGVAAPIWANFMKCSEPFLQDSQFIPPDNVVFVRIDSLTHRRADRYTPPDRVIREVYVKGTEPPEYFNDSQSDEYDLPTPRRPKRRSFWDLFDW